MHWAGPGMSARAIACWMHGMRSGRGQGLIAFCTYLDTQSSIEQDYLPSFLLGNKFENHFSHKMGKGSWAATLKFTSDLLCRFIIFSVTIHNCNVLLIIGTPSVFWLSTDNFRYFHRNTWWSDVRTSFLHRKSISAMPHPFLHPHILWENNLKWSLGSASLKTLLQYFKLGW